MGNCGAEFSHQSNRHRYRWRPRLFPFLSPRLAASETDAAKGKRQPHLQEPRYPQDPDYTQERPSPNVIHYQWE
jgi:hypothetical protein